MQTHIWAMNFSAAGTGTSSLGVMVPDTLCQPITSHLCSGNKESCRTTAETPGSPLSVHFTSNHPSLSAEHIQSKNRARQLKQGMKCQVTALLEELKRH